MSRKALIVMAKRPSPGRTKTRLTPFFSGQEAADLYNCFLMDALDQARGIAGITRYIAYAPDDEETRRYFAEKAPDFGLIPQLGNTLGERLDFVLSSCRQEGHGQVAAMNSDSPSLPVDYLALAFERLDDRATDVVLGPCDDGGYYLIGWKRPYPRLVREVQMSTSHVLADTLALAKEEKLHVAMLPTWYDVDELPDLVRVQRDLRTRGSKRSHAGDFLAKRHFNLESGREEPTEMPALQ